MSNIVEQHPHSEIPEKEQKSAMLGSRIRLKRWHRRRSGRPNWPAPFPVNLKSNIILLDTKILGIVLQSAFKGPYSPNYYCPLTSVD